MPPPATSSKKGLIILLVGISLLIGLALLASSRRAERSDGKLHIVCSFLPVYVFTLNVVGEAQGVQVDLLMSADGGCPHDHALRPSDRLTLNHADLIIASGLGAEPFLDALLESDRKSRLLTISDDVQPIPAKCEAHEEDAHDEAAHETAASREAPAHAGCTHQHDHGEYNSHVWASPAQAARQVRTLGRKLAQADPARAAIYTANAGRYAARLEELAQRLKSAVQGFPNRDIVTFHDAFAYLARDTGLNVVATLTVDPQMGISASRMRELSETLKRHKVAAICYEPAYSDRVARTLAAETNVPAIALNPFNYITEKPDAGAYERVMEDNLKALQTALGDKP